MKTLCRAAALAALSLSVLSFAAPPAAPAAPAAPTAPAVEYPLSCAAASKPLYAKAREAQFNARMDEARSLFKQVLAADPKCTMAKAMLATLTPGAEGRASFTEALGLTAGLSEVEKTELKAMEAGRKGDPEQALALRTKARDLAPNVYELNLALAEAANWPQRWDVVVAAAKKATELNPKAGAGWNMLGYGYVGQHAYPDAIAAFRKYVELFPTESNPHDSLADALLANGQLDEAGAEYQKAIDVSNGTFWMSATGVAAVKGLRGDYDGARAALEKGVAAATLPQDKAELGNWIAWTLFAQGKLADALKAVDANEKAAVAAKLDGTAAWAPVTRGALHLYGGKPADALKQYAVAEKVKMDSFTPGGRRFLTSERLSGVLQAHALAGKVAEAEKVATELEAVFKDTPGSPNAIDAIAYARGVIALAKKDAKGAVMSFSKCTELADLCHLRLAEAQDLAGDATAATQTRTALLKANRRDAFFFWVRTRAEAAQKAPGKKVAADTVKK